MKINLDSLVARLDEDLLKEFSKDDLKFITKSFFEQIAKNLEQANRIELRGFGSFSVRNRTVPSDPRKNKRGENNKVSTCNYVYFRSAKKLDDILNKK